MSGSLTKSDQSFMRQFGLLLAALHVVALFCLVAAWLIYSHEPKETDPNQSQKIAERIEPAGAVYAGNTGRAAMAAAQEAATKAAAAQVAFGGSTDGKTIYEGLCHSCHTTGVAGAPKLGNKAAWAPRIAEGIDTLIKHATEGYHGPDGNYMPPKGGMPSLTDEQVKSTVKWIVDQAK